MFTSMRVPWGESGASRGPAFQGWVAVRSMVPRDTAQKVMDALWEIGARGILVTEINACRL